VSIESHRHLSCFSSDPGIHTASALLADCRQHGKNHAGCECSRKFSDGASLAASSCGPAARGLPCSRFLTVTSLQRRPDCPPGLCRYSPTQDGASALLAGACAVIALSAWQEAFRVVEVGAIEGAAHVPTRSLVLRALAEAGLGAAAALPVTPTPLLRAHGAGRRRRLLLANCERAGRPRVRVCSPSSRPRPSRSCGERWHCCSRTQLSCTMGAGAQRAPGVGCGQASNPMQ
jgi:hypothetical protein